MSENSPLISVNCTRHKRNASVGLPVKYTEARIDPLDGHSAEKTAEGYTIGEIVVKSPSIMQGYYERPDATAEVIGPDGWLHTGDLGYIDDLGFIYINGRAKNLIVSAGGKNIYPEEIEIHFAGSKTVEQILVVGRRSADQGELVYAVVVPNKELIAQAHPEKRDANGSVPEDFVKELVKKEIEAVNRTLPSYKKISDFCLRKDRFETNAQQKIRRFLYKDYETE
jgi:long-chain acyl-CoA synthetase